MKPIVIPAQRRGKRRIGKVLRVVVDVALGCAIIGLMSTAMVREFAHEYLGMATFSLFIVHQWLNRRWWTGLARGHRNARRAAGTLVDIALAVCIFGQAASALVLSKYALGWLPAIDGAWWARIVHLLCSYWGLAFMGVHIGLHAGGVGRKLSRRSTALAWAWRIAAVALAAAGAWAFVDLDLASYMLLKVEYVFFDPTIALWITAAKFTLVAALFAVVGGIVDAALRKASRKSTAEGSKR